METITACENVCRDFHWLWSIDPRLVQAFFTFLSTLFAASVALWIAYRAYPAQKLIDRENEKSKERRQIYLELISNINAISDAIIEIGKIPHEAISQGDRPGIDFDPDCIRDFSAEVGASMRDLLGNTSTVVTRVLLVSNNNKTKIAAINFQDTVLSLAKSWGGVYSEYTELDLKEFERVWREKTEVGKAKFRIAQQKIFSAFASEIQGREVKIEIGEI